MANYKQHIVNETESNWFEKIHEHICNCYTLPYYAVSNKLELFGRNVIAFKILDYNNGSKLDVIELWHDGVSESVGSSINLTRSEYTFTEATSPKEIYDDFIYFLSGFIKIDALDFDKLIANTWKFEI